MDFCGGVHPISPSSTSSSSSNSSSRSIEGGIRLPSDEELRREGLEKVVQRLRFVENEHKKILVDRSRSMRDVNKKLQVHLMEVRGVREVNQRLMHDKEILLKEKEDLSGICCFLDDDREKAKKVAREWQMFGRYATGVLQKELAACHLKIKDIELKQATLVQENKNLKELCLMLDNDQAGSRSSVGSQGSLPGPPVGLLNVAGTRDSGDGSSNGSTTSNCSPDHRNMSSSLKESNFNPADGKGDGYVRYLEHKVRQLENEAKGRVKRVTMPPVVSNPQPTPPQIRGSVVGSPGKLERKFFSSSVLTTSSNNDVRRAVAPLSHLSGSESNLSSNQSSPQKPEAIVYAMKVLELHDQLDDKPVHYPLEYPPTYPPDTTLLDEKEKAMVREMCNVVWRKLGDNKSKQTRKHSLPRTASVSNL